MTTKDKCLGDYIHAAQRLLDHQLNGAYELCEIHKTLLIGVRNATNPYVVIGWESGETPTIVHCLSFPDESKLRTIHLHMPKIAHMSTQDIYNAIQINDLITTSGQPTEDQLKDAAAEGFSTVINLAPHNSRNALPDEAGLVGSLGMTYCYIPVKWDNPTESDFAAFEKTLSEHASDKTLIHCAANFRVTAFYSLYAQKHLGWSKQQAEDFRAKIWEGSDFGEWEDFINLIRAQLP